MNVKTIDELSEKYNVIGDDRGIAYACYENLINLDCINPEDAEEIVYQDMKFECQYVADDLIQALNYMVDMEITITGYTILESGRVALYVD